RFVQWPAWGLKGRRWVLSSIGVGVLPLLIAWSIASSFHQVVTGLLLAFLLLPCLRWDDFRKALFVTATVGATHCMLAIGLSAHDPTTEPIFPGAATYWTQTHHWILTGEDPEYQWRHWLPAHLTLLVAVPASAWASLGFIPFALGFEQLDLMNYYVGQLLRQSHNPLVAVGAGWHPWSILRAVGYFALTFEAASRALEWWLRMSLSTPARRRQRWCLGLGFALADCLTKLFLAPFLQALLRSNLVE
ncbi:MAG: hypothetical protein ACRCZF_23895, partial [Gemmataceae bacterium]